MRKLWIIPIINFGQHEFFTNLLISRHKRQNADRLVYNLFILYV